MLRQWNHPLASDEDFRHELLEQAAEALVLAAAGQSLIAGLKGKHTNLVAAIWYVESLAVGTEAERTNVDLRRQWLDAVRHALPSCFCDPNRLH
jgi:uncharacterized membrane protein